MSTTVHSKAKRSKKTRQCLFAQKPRGVLHPRVQAVGPDHFGLVCVDCAKARSKWMLCDFYGNVLIQPTEVTHAKGDFDAMILLVRDAMEKRHLKDLVVAIERTGNYHQPIKRAFEAAKFETRIVHPFATKQFRQPANPGNKTDDTDLAAIFCAAISGFGLQELPLNSTYQELRLLTRHRRDLVEKRSALCCQIREHLEAVMPGYAACFSDLWKSPIALDIVRYFPSADASATIHHRLWQSLDEDRQRKSLEIQALECEFSRLLVQTPYLLLLSFPGLNIVSVAELAGEMGPIEHYATAKSITGRAGLFPARYQSDRVDVANGKLIRCANRSLRRILLMISANLIKCNAYFRALAAAWKAQQKDPRRSHVKVACRFSRIVFQMVAGRLVFNHSGCRQRDYILQKLLAYLQQHDMPMPSQLAILQQAIQQIPKAEYVTEAMPLNQELQKLTTAKRGPQPIGEILIAVLARLGVGEVQSNTSEVQDPS